MNLLDKPEWVDAGTRYNPNKVASGAPFYDLYPARDVALSEATKAVPNIDDVSGITAADWANLEKSVPDVDAALGGGMSKPKTGLTIGDFSGEIATLVSGVTSGITSGIQGKKDRAKKAEIERRFAEQEELNKAEERRQQMLLKDLQDRDKALEAYNRTFIADLAEVEATWEDELASIMDGIKDIESGDNNVYANKARNISRKMQKARRLGNG